MRHLMEDNMKDFQWKKLLVIEIWLFLLFITDIILMNYRPELEILGGTIALVLIGVAISYAIYQLLIAIMRMRSTPPREDVSHQ